MVSKDEMSRSRTGRLVAGFVLSLLMVPALLAACDSGTTGGQDPASELERGKTVFARYCNVCHPGGRAGSGPALPALALKLSDEQITYVVRNGKNRMPAYKTTDISDAELVGLITYVRSLK